MVRRVRVYISGTVQGVSFRATTQARAEAHGEAGWVRNLDDRRVEAVFEGGEDAVDAMLDFCHEGPPRASVTDVTVDEEEPEDMSGFRVRR